MQTNLPHTRGDEPAGTLELRVDGHGICPTRVGMNRWDDMRFNGVDIICPTRVGMNRALTLHLKRRM